MRKKDIVQQGKVRICALNVSGGLVAFIVAVLAAVWSPDATAAVENAIEGHNGVGNVPDYYPWSPNASGSGRLVTMIVENALSANPRPQPVLLAPPDAKFVSDAAAVFADLWEKVTGHKPKVVSELPDKGDVVVFGEECWNSFTRERRLDGMLPPNRFRDGSDAYRLLSRKDGDRTVLFLLNARPRSLFYAVYRFFELRADCAWFWDGDRVPKGPKPDIGGLDLTESPRFDWRGLRYFAHRSLHRFQAEHWTFDDWKREVDWMLKRRLNFFMLRIGQDDFFQKAFPDVVPYGDGWNPIGSTANEGYNDRSLMWPLKTHAAIRKALMDYAHDRDLVHCADTGTMMHWYSRTPESFLEKMKPDFLKGSNPSHMGDPSSLVWDIMQDKWLDAYWKVTQADVDNYSGADMFHTIGLSERAYFGDDEEKNFRLKQLTYRRIVSKLREHYPDAPLLIGTWDFREDWKWTPERVRALVETFDPRNTILLDYISDLPEGNRNLFTHWGVVGRFPWMFGVFHAYEAHNTMRGNYPQIYDRLPIAAADPMCKGVFMWAENSHQDTLMLDYFGAMGWDPSGYRLETFLPDFCRRRYGEGKDGKMLALWRAMVPVLSADSWHLCCDPAKTPLLGDYPAAYGCVRECQYCLLDDRRMRYYRDREKTTAPLRGGMARLLSDLASLGWKDLDEFARRDGIDMARAIFDRALEGDVARLGLAIDERRRLPPESSQSRKEEMDSAVRSRLSKLRAGLHLLGDVLESAPEFSLNDSLSRIQAAGPHNPDFETTLKHNASTGYCRGQIYELIRHVAERQAEVVEEYLEEAMSKSDGFADWNSERRGKELGDRLYGPIKAFNARPLSEMVPSCDEAFARLPDTLRRAAETIGN